MHICVSLYVWVCSYFKLYDYVTTIAGQGVHVTAFVWIQDFSQENILN